jgi:aspartate racemase
MQIPGIVGGIAPESTILYYRLAIDRYRERRKDGSYPPILISSIDLKGFLDLVGAGRLGELTEFLLKEIERLARAGADFGALASNTPHLVFDALAAASPLPLISIVETTAVAARTRGLRRLGLLGTRFTMQARFYPDGLARAGIEVVVPNAGEQDYVNEKYFAELVGGTVKEETRRGLLSIVERLRVEDGIDGLILGGTELSLILQGRDEGFVILDTLRLHVDAIVESMLQ